MSFGQYPKIFGSVLEPPSLNFGRVTDKFRRLKEENIIMEDNCRALTMSLKVRESWGKKSEKNQRPCYIKVQKR